VILKSAGQLGRLETQGRVDVAAQFGRKFAVEFILPLRASVFFS
jgi:hypothetical protein